jgi:hypothetical protein
MHRCPHEAPSSASCVPYAPYGHQRQVLVACACPSWLADQLSGTTQVRCAACKFTRIWIWKAFPCSTGTCKMRPTSTEPHRLTARRSQITQLRTPQCLSGLSGPNSGPSIKHFNHHMLYHTRQKTVCTSLHRLQDRWARTTVQYCAGTTVTCRVHIDPPPIALSMACHKTAA